MRATSYDFARLFKTQGFLFETDTVRGKIIGEGIAQMTKKANTLLDTFIETLAKDTTFFMFAPSEIAAAAIIAVRTAIGLDQPFCELMEEYLRSDLVTVLSIERMVYQRHYWIYEAAYDMFGDVEGLGSSLDHPIVVEEEIPADWKFA